MFNYRNRKWRDIFSRLRKKGVSMPQSEPLPACLVKAVQSVEKMIQNGMADIDFKKGTVVLPLLAHVELLGMPDSEGFNESLLYHRYCTLFRQYINFHRGLHLGNLLHRIEQGEFDHFRPSGDGKLIAEDSPTPLPSDDDYRKAKRRLLSAYLSAQWKCIAPEEPLTLVVVDNDNEPIQIVKEVLQPQRAIDFFSVTEKEE